MNQPQNAATTAKMERLLSKIMNTSCTHILPVSFLPHVTNVDSILKLAGHYLCFRKGARLVFEPTNHYHYLGIHECLCLTVRRPPGDGGIWQHGQCLNTIPPFGRTQWIGQVMVSSKHIKSYSNRIYLPLAIWKPHTPVIGKRIHTHAIIHDITGQTPYGRKDFKYTIAEFPAFGRNGLFPQYTIQDNVDPGK